MENPVFKQAKEALERLSADPRARELAEMREMALLTYEVGVRMENSKAREQGMAEGVAEGKAVGVAEGRVEGRAEVLRHQLRLKFGELPEAVSLRFAGARADDVLRWSERVLSATTLTDVFEP